MGESREGMLLSVNLNFTRVDWRNFDRKDRMTVRIQFPFLLMANAKTTRFRSGREESDFHEMSAYV